MLVSFTAARGKRAVPHRRYNGVMPTPYETARSELESFTKEGRPDQVLRQILVLDWYHPHPEDFQKLKESLAIASARGAEHLTDDRTADARRASGVQIGQQEARL